MGMLFIGLSFLLLLQFRIVFKKGAKEMTVFISLMALTGMIVWVGVFGIILLIWMENR